MNTAQLEVLKFIISSAYKIMAKEHKTTITAVKNAVTTGDMVAVNHFNKIIASASSDVIDIYEADEGDK